MQPRTEPRPLGAVARVPVTFPFRPAGYHTRQALALTMGWPAWQEYAFWNSGMF